MAGPGNSWSGRNQLKLDLFCTSVLAFVIGAPFGALADGKNANSSSNADSYYFAFDELALRRDIARIRHFYVDPPPTLPAAGGNADMIYLGGPAQGGFVGFWGPDAPDPASTIGANSWLDRMEFGFDWRPDVTDLGRPAARTISRMLTTGDIEHVGVRADLTALLYGEEGSSEGVSAWRITGMLGSTSLSLATSGLVPESNTPGSGDLQWDIGVGWSSGAVSVSAGYESTHREVEGNPSGIAVLSFGADYAVLPGLSVYGEFNVVDDPAIASEQGLGTVIVVGTGLNF